MEDMDLDPIQSKSAFNENNYSFNGIGAAMIKEPHYRPAFFYRIFLR